MYRLHGRFFGFLPGELLALWCKCSKPQLQEIANNMLARNILQTGVISKFPHFGPYILQAELPAMPNPKQLVLLPDSSLAMLPFGSLVGWRDLRFRHVHPHKSPSDSKGASSMAYHCDADILNLSVFVNGKSGLQTTFFALKLGGLKP